MDTLEKLKEIQALVNKNPEEFQELIGKADFVALTDPIKRYLDALADIKGMDRPKCTSHPYEEIE